MGYGAQSASAVWFPGRVTCAACLPHLSPISLPPFLSHSSAVLSNKGKKPQKYIYIYKKGGDGAILFICFICFTLSFRSLWLSCCESKHPRVCYVASIKPSNLEQLTLLQSHTRPITPSNHSSARGDSHASEIGGKTNKGIDILPCFFVKLNHFTVFLALYSIFTWPFSRGSAGYGSWHFSCAACTLRVKCKSVSAKIIIVSSDQNLP